MLPIFCESSSSNANSSYGSKFSSIQCYLVIDSISSIYIKTKSCKSYPYNVIAIIYHPNLDMNILSDPFMHEKPIKRLLYQSKFSKKNKIPFSLWQSMNDSLILPLRLDLELSIMTNEQRIIIGRTIVNINQDKIESNDWFNVDIIPSKCKIGFWKSKVTTKYSFKGYPESSYRFDNAKVRVRIQKISYSSVKSQIYTSSHDIANPKIPTSIPVMVESMESCSQLTGSQYESRNSHNISFRYEYNEIENSIIIENKQDHTQHFRKISLPQNYEKNSNIFVGNSLPICLSPDRRTLSISTIEKKISITSPPAVNRLTIESNKSNFTSKNSLFSVEKKKENSRTTHSISIRFIFLKKN